MITSLIKAYRNTERTLKANSPAVLASLSGVGVVTSVYLASRASWNAALEVKAFEEDPDVEPYLDRNDMLKQRARLVWKHYIPPAISTSTTLGCIYGTMRAGNHKTAVALTAATVTERAFNEYREKVIEQIGEKKEEAVREAIAQDTVRNDPPREVLISNGGDVLCCELYTRRYFTCDMQTLRKAQNDINAMLVNDLYATLSDFYYMIGLSPTSDSSNIGWDSDKLMELEFSTVLADDDRPCLAFSYNYTKVL